MNTIIKRTMLVIMTILATATLVACGNGDGNEEIVLAEGDWESIEVHNQIAKLILEEGYGEKVDITSADTPVITQSMISGDMDVNLEMWSGNIPTYEEDLEDGHYEEVSVNFDDNYQGLYIPKYLQEENPGLTSIQDLPDYKELFPDNEVNNWDPEEDKGVIHGGPSGWAATAFLEHKFENEDDYPELVDAFDFRPLESTATLNSTLVTAYEEEEPWVGYNWEPTWILGQYEMVLLEDEIPFESADDEEGKGNLPPQDVTVIITSGFKDQFPDVTEFLSHYETSSAITSDALAYMRDNEVEPVDAAKYFLEEYEDLWTEWVPEDVADNVKAAIE
ncbi:MAG: glycine betaine ABC transporter substrate-binding protein [Bacillota bacterium]